MKLLLCRRTTIPLHYKLLFDNTMIVVPYHLHHIVQFAKMYEKRDNNKINNELQSCNHQFRTTITTTTTIISTRNVEQTSGIILDPSSSIPTNNTDQVIM